MTRTIFNDGSKEEKYLREAIITPMATLEKTGTASNYSVRLRAGANYDVVHVGFVDYFKVTKFWAAGTLLDGQCRMTRLDKLVLLAAPVPTRTLFTTTAI